jgi:hypothetical protein
MSHPPDPRSAVRYIPGPATVRLALAAAAAVWLVALGGLIGTLVYLPELAWPATIFPILLCGSPASALWATRRAVALRQVWTSTPDALLDQRHHGNLAALAHTAVRPLRPIGISADEIAERTGDLLDDLAAAPNVRILRAVRPAGTALPVISHAVTAGRTLILVESVAWPPGRYLIDADGRIRCDHQYIGQSVGALTAAVRQTRRLLPRNHQVSGLVVVHRTGDGGRYTLPTASDGLAWVLAEEAAPRLRGRLAADRITVSRHALAALRADPDAAVVTA